MPCRRAADDLEARGPVRLAELSSGAEIHEDDAAAVLAHHVLCLDVAVDDADAMDGAKSARHKVVAGNPAFSGAEPALSFHDLRERLTVNQLHTDADVAIEIARVVDRDDVRCRTSPAVGLLEGLLDLPGMTLGDCNQLERDFTRQRRMERTVDGAEAAMADLVENLEFARAITPSLPQAGAAVDGRAAVRASRGAFETLPESRLGEQGKQRRDDIRDRPAIADRFH